MNTAYFFSDTEVQELIEKFVNLVLYGRNLFIPDQFSQEDAPIIEKAVELAGYEVKRLELGTLIHQYCDDGNNHDFKINEYCPFIVIGSDEKADLFATAWVDFIFEISKVLRRSQTSQEEKGVVFLRELKQYLTFQPIRLTEYGDILQNYPHRPSFDFENRRYRFFPCSNEESLIDATSTGIHKFCGGIMECTPVTENHKALVCRKCYLRILIPKEVITYADLREYMENSLS